MTIRKSEARGHFNHGWLDTYHTFSFGEYHDPGQMGFRTLRVINEDRVEAGEGFGTHPHRDMEIITYVLKGALEHQDSMGNGSVIRAGEVQRMSAGRGVTHSEYNASQKETVHLLQIWILPEQKGLMPSYEQKNFSKDEKKGQLRLIASQNGRNESLRIHQDANIHATLLEAGQTILYPLREDRHAWIQVARGDISLNDMALTQGDGVAVNKESSLEITAKKESELLLFELA